MPTRDKNRLKVICKAPYKGRPGPLLDVWQPGKVIYRPSLRKCNLTAYGVFWGRLERLGP